jgi:drug/metabolite transporter (DMT)-like permease
VTVSDAQARWLRAMPAVFVLIWSTGFVVARFGMPHAPPFSFLSWRYALSCAAFLLWVKWARAAWPQGGRQWLHLAATGVLMHGGYLGGVWSAVKLGLGAGTASLIVGLQPLLTALWMSAMGSEHRVSARQWLGLSLGLAGLTLVVWHRLGMGEASAPSLAWAVAALLSITAGTLYQKRFVRPCDVRSANLVQLAAALAVSLPLALAEPQAMDWTRELVGAMGWSVLVLTLGGSSLLYLLIQRGAATQVASLMYLVPPCTAVLAWVLFGEALGLRVLGGIGLAVAGVVLVTRTR